MAKAITFTAGEYYLWDDGKMLVQIVNNTTHNHWHISGARSLSSVPGTPWSTYSHYSQAGRYKHVTREQALMLINLWKQNLK